jgi:hypothetical protein
MHGVQSLAVTSSKSWDVVAHASGVRLLLGYSRKQGRERRYRSTHDADRYRVARVMRGIRLAALSSPSVLYYMRASDSESLCSMFLLPARASGPTREALRADNRSYNTICPEEDESAR